MAAIAVVGAALLGSNYSQTQMGSLGADARILDQIHAMGGLELVMPEAFAETDCTALDETGRNVVEFDLVGTTVELPIIGGDTYTAMTFSGQVPGPTLRVTQG